MQEDSANKKKSNSAVEVTDSENYKLECRGYKIKRKINSGFSASIFLTVCSRLNRPDILMACKVIDKKSADQKFIHKFLPREIEILATIRCRHCVQVYSILEIRNKMFIFMRYADNGDLLEYLSRNGPTEEPHARLWIRQMMLALKYLHERGIAHRDIKCENILITGNFNAKLADFGFSRYWIDRHGNELKSETYCGSISYAPPEILAGRPYVPRYCDMWSMGVVFFIMINLKKPFSRNKAGDMLSKQLAKSYKFQPRVERSMSKEGRDIIIRMLEPDTRLRATPEYVLSSEWMRSDENLEKLLPY